MVMKLRIVDAATSQPRPKTDADVDFLRGVEGSLRNPDTQEEGMAEKRGRRRFTAAVKAQAVKRLPALNLILQLGERDLAHARQADGLSGRLRQVDDPAVSVRTPVVDAHHHRAARALVRNSHP